ncbi:MAG: carbonic anhydrase, partial [Hallella bergensis]
DLMKQRGVSDEALAEASKHVDLENYLSGFEDIEEDVRRIVTAIQHHPLMPRQFVVRGFMIDSYTGELSEVK